MNSKKAFVFLFTLAAFGLMPLMAHAQNPVPAITGISPSTVAHGSSTITLTVNGSGFMAGSIVYLNGAPRATTFNSSTQVTAILPVADLNVAGTANITVFNPAPAGGFSNTALLTMSTDNPVPAITSISPSSKTEGDAAFTLTVNGTNFISSSSVRFDNSARATTFISSTQLTASIPATDVVSAGTDAVTVFNPGPGGGTSNAAIFTTLAPGTLAPAVTSISPTSMVVGSGQFTLTVSGTNFDSNTVVQLNGSARATTFISPTVLSATIPASDMVTVGVRSITANDPERGISNSVLFVVTQVPGLPDTGVGPDENSGFENASITLGVLGLASLVSGLIVRRRLLLSRA